MLGLESMGERVEGWIAAKASGLMEKAATDMIQKRFPGVAGLMTVNGAPTPEQQQPSGATASHAKQNAGPANQVQQFVMSTMSSFLGPQAKGGEAPSPSGAKQEGNNEAAPNQPQAQAGNPLMNKVTQVMGMDINAAFNQLLSTLVGRHGDKARMIVLGEGLTGALAGYGIGKTIGNQFDQPGLAGLIGAIIGGLASMMIGNRLIGKNGIRPQTEAPAPDAAAKKPEQEQQEQKEQKAEAQEPTATAETAPEATASAAAHAPATPPMLLHRAHMPAP